jgi:hypothetical protein
VTRPVATLLGTAVAVTLVISGLTARGGISEPGAELRMPPLIGLRGDEAVARVCGVRASEPFPFPVRMRYRERYSGELVRLWEPCPSD